MKGLTLIGMPGSGKSTTAQMLATLLGWPMLDVDRWMMEKEQISTAEILKREGAEAIFAREAECVQKHDLHDLVLATPGCVIYTPAYERISQETEIFCLQASLATITSRLKHDLENERGIVGLEEKGLEGIYAQRMPLYEQWADRIVSCDGKSADTVCTEILRSFKSS